MRILVVGAGAIGGYFGGRLLQDGRDVTFLVRPGRAGELADAGLVIKSPNGDVTLKNPPMVLAGNLKAPFDLVLLSCKAFDLDDAMASFAPAVGPATAVLPLLNGLRHLETLDAKFGRERVLGGQCVVAATLDQNRHVVQLNPMHAITFGERDGGLSERVNAIAEAMNGAMFDVHPSANIMQEMWEKWVFLASLAGSTSVMRASTGDILASPGGAEFMLGVLDECAAVASAAGFAPRDALIERSRGMMLAEGSSLTASMFRDIKAGAPVEADHVIGDLIARGDAAKVPVPRLRVIYTHLKAYERQRG
ncbi:MULTISPECIES: 2-dehydropantoate 2-reductase [Rhodopseudomonas]|uniref:2-dehydropantoate 2-reductase n=1 Tax=Rhodopseudomonas palustris TaxID=1076 RepID=A0A0D7EI22_RHOPL|nr:MULTISPECIES: 2-dehydropantoate 2-reductase [Rhodopseudomonas]KIZ39167.1 2-dehydropantoate 2-reductase [Rhodopseudomonas palustris]MDF3811164.1 2-dehydropantoate 2-reductase [Rhodopseudomonas sp. BAL398]WOK16767.1 2-dehydropantoate 2-reductase [Rhodopseudomonas sp. BAL398]